MSGLGWKVWGSALFASLVVHAGVATTLRMPAGDVGGGGGPEVSVAGSLEGVLGGAVGGARAEPAAVRAVARRAIEAAPSVVHAERPVAVVSERVPPVEAQAAAGAVQASAASVVPGVAAPLPAAPAVAAREVRPQSKPVPPPVPAARPEAPVSVPRRPPPVREVVRRPDVARSRGEAERSRRRRERKARAEQPAGSASRAGTRRQGAGGVARAGRRQRPQAAGAGAVRSYGARVRDRILSNRPSGGGTGRAVVTFGLSGAGGLRFVRLARSSGNATLDRAALAAVRRSHPFPRPPNGASASQLTFSISFNFR